MGRLDRKVAIITGGGTGIGRASALRFAEEGAAVVVSGRRVDPLQSVVSEIEGLGGRAHAVSADVGVPEDAEKLISETVDHFGELHVLFNNAATVDLNRKVEEMSLEEWDHCLNVTLRSVFLLSKHAAPSIRDAGGGAIINCGTVGATMPWEGGAAYCAAKAGVLALTKVLAIEYGKWNIRVNTLSPGAILTDNLRRAMEELGHEEKLRSKSVYKRIGEPEEIAAVAAFLASEEASFMAGSNVLVDGGYLTL